jgi:hypothetical protein
VLYYFIYIRHATFRFLEAADDNKTRVFSCSSV